MGKRRGLIIIIIWTREIMMMKMVVLYCDDGRGQEEGGSVRCLTKILMPKRNDDCRRREKVAG
jgi:hypothetical protein